MTNLVIIEHHQGQLAASSLSTITAATKVGAVTAVVAGHSIAGVSTEVAKVAGVEKVLQFDSEVFKNQLAEPLSQTVSELAKEAGASHVWAPASTFGKNLMPRVAALLDVEQISDIIAVHSASSFDRPIYAGNAIATVESSESVHVVTVRASAFDKAGEQAECAIESKAASATNSVSEFVSAQLAESDRPELTAADIIVSGGRGVGSGEAFNVVEALADKLGAAVGASRAAVDAGFVPNDWQVGQTGKIVAPQLYIAAGISGQIQHLAGMKDSKVIVAINTDEEAPIFQVADYGLVGDLFEVLPEMTGKL
jgi:electron transfer flavoprotein alpha subunit